MEITDFFGGFWKDKLESNQSSSQVFGIQDAPFWFYFSIDSETPTERIVYLDYPLTDYIDLYQVENDSILSVQKTGDMTPFDTRALDNFAFALPVKLKKGTNAFYVKIQSENSIQFTPTIYTERSLYQSISKNNIVQGLFYGWLLVMFFYNLFLFFSTKDRNFIYMCFVTLFNGFMFLSSSGYGLQYIWRDALEWNQISFIVFAVSVSIINVIFSASFLELARKNRKLFNYHKVVGLVFVMLLICTPFCSYSQLIKPTMLFVLHNSIFFPITAIIVYRKGSRRAKYFLLAWSVYFIGTITAINAGTNITLPIWLKSFHILQIGAALEVLLFSIALGDTINQLREKVLLKEMEKNQLKTKLIIEHNVQLEKTVAERTKDLKEANIIKDKFFAIIAHDLRSSVTSFQGMGKIINSYLKRNDTEKVSALSGKIDRASSQLSAFLDNLLNWAFTQLNNVPYHPKAIDLATICREEIGFKQELLNSKQMETSVQIATDKKAFADENGIRLIVGNLLNNAIKFTDQNGSIAFDISSHSNQISLKISDTGVGMEPEKLAALFTLKRHNTTAGTSGEKGSGLGLILCKEFAELNKGTLHVESELNKGTHITLQLPLTTN